MEHFVTIERAIACPRASVAVAAETAAQVLASAGYRRGLGFGPTSSYVRAYRPPWVVGLAFVGALPTLGLALLLLRYRSKDHCNVVIENGPYGVVALVSGRVPAGLPAALENASGEYLEQQGQQQYGEAYQQQRPPPVLLAPSGGQDGSPSHTPQAILRPATPIPGVEYGVDYGSAPAGQGYAQYGQPQYGQPQNGQPQYGQPQYGQPQYGQPQYGQQQPGPPAGPQSGPEWARRPDDFPLEQSSQPPAPVPVRPPSKLAPPMPSDGGREQPASGQPANPGAKAGPPAQAPPAADDDPFSSTSGRVPWVGGGRPGPLPAPPVPAVSGPGGPGGTGAASAPTVRAATALSDHTPVLRVDSGEVLEIGPFCLLGREPAARDGDPEARLIRFEDPKLSVSKTHMAYGVDGQGIWIMDRNSTNGTTVIDPEGRRTPCAPGARHYVVPGFQVQVGQRRIKVEAPGGGPA